jgi:hydroxymethylbilane synthase
MPLRLGTRGSALARWQAEWVAARLKELGIEVALTPISTTGDRRHEAIGAIGGEGVFTKEIQLALLDGRIDLAVHSLKDLPTNATPGLCLAAVPERSHVADVLVSADRASLAKLPSGAAIGTGSLRRRAQLLHFRRDLHIKDIRGNVDTRLQKLRQGAYDAIVLAEAGLRRLNFADYIAQILPLSIMLPAVGQGALGLETREDDAETRRTVARLDHPPSHAAVLAERAMLSALRGGCMAPIAALGRIEGGTLTLTGRVVGHDGVKLLEISRTAPSADAELLGRQVADALLAQGAGELIRVSREA